MEIKKNESMKSLLDIITYDDKKYSSISDSSEKKAIENIAAKLKHLEGEILQHIDGDISITKKGNVFVMCFPIDLSAKIRQALA